MGETEIEGELSIDENGSLKEFIKKAPLKEVLKAWRSALADFVPKLRALPQLQRRRILKKWASYKRFLLFYSRSAGTIRDLELYQKWTR